MERGGILNTGHVTDAGNLQVLMYHHVSNKTGLVTLSPRTFRAQMKWLAESGGKTADVFLSRERMKEMLGYCSLHLCWPKGYYNHGYIEVAKELGFSYLYTTERHYGKANEQFCQWLTAYWSYQHKGAGKRGMAETSSVLLHHARIFFTTGPA